MRWAVKAMILGLAVAINLIAPAPRVLAAPGKPPPKPAPPVVPNAGYEATVAGCYTGTGKATTGGGKVSINAAVTDDNGAKGDLTITDLKVDDKLHFNGTGTAFGKTIKVTGRLDPVPANDPQL